MSSPLETIFFLPESFQLGVEFPLLVKQREQSQIGR